MGAALSDMDGVRPLRELGTGDLLDGASRGVEFERRWIVRAGSSRNWSSYFVEKVGSQQQRDQRPYPVATGASAKSSNAELLSKSFEFTILNGNFATEEPD